YSPNNPLKDSGFHRFIPDAGGYPFTETEYTQDNTGRISRQSGVGTLHRLGSGHETKYYYGTPDQSELDALFGTEVGDHSHYYKTMVRDANGQYSVSYTDMHGRTIATALAGETPDSIKLDKLPSFDTANITVSLADPSTNVIKDLSMETQKGLLVEKKGWHTFTYKLNPQSMQQAGCDSVPICYDCLYDLQITINGDCNNQSFGGAPFDTVLHSFAVIDTSCATAVPGFNFSFSKFLEEGSYDITKRLSVSRTAMDYYRDSIFMKKNACYTVDSFINAQRVILAAQEMCKPVCAQCEDSLGTQSQFATKFKQRAGIEATDTSYNGMIAQAYAEALDNCRQLCQTTTIYDDIRKDMLLDMTAPSGQYANPDNQADIRSIFYAQSYPSADSVADFRKPHDYKDEMGVADKVYDELAGDYVVPEKLSMETFVSKFKLSWAEALLPYHPEYCKLQKYEALKASLQWDVRFNATDTYADAMKKGYLNPTSDSTTLPYKKFNATDGADVDPILSLSGYDYKSALRAELLKVGGNNINGGLSMWAMANIGILCRDDNTPSCVSNFSDTAKIFNPSLLCTGDLDMAWRAFRQMYQTAKQNLIQAQLKTSPCNTTVSPGTLLAERHQPHFGEAGELLGAAGITTPGSLSAANTEMSKQQGLLDSSYNSNCRSYVSFWLQQLAPCNYSSTDTAAIIPLLVQVCREGSDMDHPYGASSVKPSSTNVYRSFEDVINAYNASHGITNTAVCNPYLITTPKPYGQQVVYSDKPVWTKPDECECARISKLYSEYQQVSSSFTSFSQYMYKQYQTTITDSVAGLLLSLCGADSSSCVYLASPISLPGAMQCNTGDVCVNCAAFKTAYDQYNTIYAGQLPAPEDSDTDSSQLAINRLFEKFMNHTLGFNKNVWEYLAFRDTCHFTGLLSVDSLKKTQETFLISGKAGTLY
ncbi:MAG: hypothetical protein JST39_01945, partial [Bacteroidetes bacterium]|nr:hypothetical protein [Bacteroidota bacterium]